MLDAGTLLKVPVRQLSLGQRMKCELIAALLHKPDVLFLDEPTIGLDAVTKLSLRAFLIELNRQRGVTMILTTHDMDDIEALCSRVMVIGKGKLLFDGGMDALRRRYAPHRVLNARLAGDASALGNLAGVDKVTVDGQAARVIFRPDVVPAEKVIADLASLCPIRDLTVEAPDIEEIVADMYREMSL
jgi:ABC-2 type transport system ATP-binding protein